MKSFFSYFGAKRLLASKYPPPIPNCPIIEPFAGSAGYSTKYNKHKVILNDKDKDISDLWKYLISSKGIDIESLPVTEDEIENIIKIGGPAANLIGRWLVRGSTVPAKKPQGWMKTGKYKNAYWGEHIRKRIAEQVDLIKNWESYNLDYDQLLNTLGYDNFEATWFIDPPYQHKGNIYKHGSNEFDYNKLAKWCKKLNGLVIVCEQEGADWLDFKPFITSKSLNNNSNGRISKEVVWYNDSLLYHEYSNYNNFISRPVNLKVM